MMRISLKADTRRDGYKVVTVQTPGEGFMAAVDTVSALTKIAYWGDLYNRDAIEFLRNGMCKEDPGLYMAGAVRCGDRTACHIIYSGTTMTRGDWVLRINVTKNKTPFAFIEVYFDRDSGEVIRVIKHLMPPEDQLRWRI